MGGCPLPIYPLPPSLPLNKVQYITQSDYARYLRYKNKIYLYNAYTHHHNFNYSQNSCFPHSTVIYNYHSNTHKQRLYSHSIDIYRTVIKPWLIIYSWYTWIFNGLCINIILFRFFWIHIYYVVFVVLVCQFF